MAAAVTAILTGRSIPFARGEHSAIGKAPVAGIIALGFLGLSGDQQADKKYHGGPDKALHHYPYEHYAQWQGVMPDQPLLLLPGAFGENVSTAGLDEGEACIGDRFRFGTALVEISQPRQPCWKQGQVFSWQKLPKLMVQQRRTGWYYRVIEEGEIAAGCPFELVDRPFPEWTVARAVGLVLGGEAKHDVAGIRALITLEVLEKSWREKARKLAALTRSAAPSKA